MESFFRFVGVFNEVEVLEFLHHRYNDVETILKMPIDEFIAFYELGKKQADYERIHAQWCAQLPYMALQRLKYISFEEYARKMRGEFIDTRSNEEIIAEIDAAHAKVGE